MPNTKYEPILGPGEIRDDPTSLGKSDDLRERRAGQGISRNQSFLFETIDCKPARIVSGTDDGQRQCSLSFLSDVERLQRTEWQHLGIIASNHPYSQTSEPKLDSLALRYRDSWAMTLGDTAIHSAPWRSRGIDSGTGRHRLTVLIGIGFNDLSLLRGGDLAWIFAGNKGQQQTAQAAPNSHKTLQFKIPCLLSSFRNYFSVCFVSFWSSMLFDMSTDLGSHPFFTAFAIIFLDIVDYQFVANRVGALLHPHGNGQYPLDMKRFDDLNEDLWLRIESWLVDHQTDFDDEMVEFLQASGLSWIIAFLTFGVWYALKEVKHRLNKWWVKKIGICRKCGSRRTTAPYKQFTHYHAGKVAFFASLIMMTHAAKPAQLLLDRGGDNQFDIQTPDHRQVAQSEVTTSRVNAQYTSACEHPNFTIANWTGHGRTNILCNSQEVSSPDFWAPDKRLIQSIAGSAVIFEQDEAGAAPFFPTGRNMVEPTGRDDFWTQESFSLMQRATLLRDEICGSHLDPTLYWDRLSYRPSIVQSRFYLWRTSPIVGQLQYDLHSIPWDGRRCVRCAVIDIPGFSLGEIFRGPYYIRPQPTVVERDPTLHFISLVTTKLSSQRALHLSVQTPASLRHGSIIVNSLAGVISSELLFDQVVPGHNCRTSSWCRVQYRLPDRTLTWWFPAMFAVEDYNHLRLDEIGTRTSIISSMTVRPSQSASSCQATTPDSGATDYVEDQNSLIQMRQKLHTAEKPELSTDHFEDTTTFMQIPSADADRSRSDTPEQNADSNDGSVHEQSDGSSSNDPTDALVIYSLTADAIIVPVQEDVPADMHKILVARHMEIDPSTEDWHMLSVHYVHPRPIDLAPCITPMIAIFRGQHQVDQAVVLVDIEMHSNSLTICGEVELPYTLREVWKMPISLTRAALIHQLGLQELCRNIAFPCIVTFGDRIWTQQDWRTNTVLNGLFIKVIVPIPKPDFPLSLYLTYARQGVSWARMTEHWNQQTNEARRRLDDMFADDPELVDSVTQVEANTDLNSLMVLANHVSTTTDEAEFATTTNSHMTERSRTPRTPQHDLVVYEFQQSSLTSTIDPSLTRREYRETIGALLDVAPPGRLWDNFEIHQVRPLPSDFDPPHTTAFIFVHPETIISSMSFALVSISVTHETEVCGRFETATDRRVHRLPARLARQTLLVNLRIWDLCMASGQDLCEVRLPDRMWDKDDVINRIIFDGAYIQVTCTTPYLAMPVQRQLRESLNGVSPQEMIRTWNAMNPVEDTLALFQITAALRRSTPFDSDPFREPTMGLRPPGNPEYFDLTEGTDEEAIEQNGCHTTPQENFGNHKNETTRILHLSDFLNIPTPMQRRRGHDTLEKQDTPKVAKESGVELPSPFDYTDDFWVFNPIRDLPADGWNVLTLPQEVTDFLQELQPSQFASVILDNEDEFALYTDGSYDGNNASWAVAIFLRRADWHFVGYLADKTRCNDSTNTSALLGEQTAIFAASWWLLTYAHASSWRGKVTFLWDCLVAGKKAQGEYSLKPHAIEQHTRHVQQALATMLGQEYVHHQHVKAHSGVIPNELVDTLARLANTSYYCPDQASAHITEILAKPNLNFEWLWIHLDQRGASDLPGFANRQWHWTPGQHPLLNFDKILNTTFRDTTRMTGLQQWTFVLQAGSYNCMTLGGDGAEHRTSFMSKVSLLRNQMTTLGYHLLGLQETRSTRGTVRSATHLRLCSGCNSDHTLGVELWVALKTPLGWSAAGVPCYFKPDSFIVLEAEPRFLAVAYNSPELSLHIIVAHAPHQGADAEQLENWWLTLTERIQKYPEQELMVFLDANQRLTQTAEPHVGDLCESGKSHREDLLVNCLVASNLMIPATWSGWQDGPIHTWTHPGTHSRSRIDYLLVPITWASSQIATWVDDTLHAGHAALDHQCTAISLRWLAMAKGEKRLSKGFDQDRMNSAESQATLRQILASAPIIPWETNATDHASELTEYLQEQLALHFPKKKTMRHWQLASNEALEVYHQLTAAKKSIRVLDKVIQGIWMRMAFDSWLGRTGTNDNFVWATKVFHKMAISCMELPRFAKMLTKQVRLDKKAYADSVAKEAHTCGPNEIFKALKPLMKSNRKHSSFLKPLPQIEKITGELTTNLDEYADRWVQHFSDIEAGTRVDPREYLETAAGLQHGQCLPTEWTSDDLPRLNDLERAIRRAGWRKAPGPDGIPNEVFKIHPALAARMLYPIACKFTLRLQEPLQYKGGQLIALSKGRGSPQQCSSFRGILLLSTAGKLIRASLRHRINLPYETQTDAFQLGGKAHQQVLFGAQGIRSFINWQKAANKSAAVLFCDVASAFYMTLRQVAVGASTGDQDIARIAAHFGLSPDIMPQLHAALQGDTSYSRLGATPVQQALLRESLRSTWFSWDATRFVETTRGTRPGDSWADVVFNVMFHQVLLQVKERLSQQGLLLEVAPPEQRTPWHGCPRRNHCIPAFHTTWADDLAIMLSFRSATGAAQSLCHAAAHLLDALHAFGMQATIGDGKTEAMLWLRGTGAVRLRQALFSKPRPVLPVLQEEEVIELPLTARYKHLGGILSSTCNLLPELRARGQKALRTYWALHQSIFRNPHIEFDTKLRIFRATVLAILTWGSGAWPLLSRQEYHLYQQQTWNLYRRIAQIKLKSHTPSRLTHAEILDMTGFAHPQDVLDEARARHLGALVTHGPDQLWALLYHDDKALAGYQQAVLWLWEAVYRETPLGDPRQQWDQWIDFIKTRPNGWKSMNKKAAVRYRGFRQRQDQVSQWHQQLAQILVDSHRASAPMLTLHPHWCLLCLKPFEQKRAWFLHAHHKHGYRSVAGLVVSGRHCPRCDRAYKDTSRLLHHLQYSKPCRQMFWHLRHQEHLGSCTVEDSHPQCPWMPYTTDFEVPNYDQTDPDLLHMREIFSHALHDFVQPEADDSFVPQLIEHLRAVCSQVCPYDIICAAFTEWAAQYSDSTDRRLLESLEAVGSWLLQPSTCMEDCPKDTPRLDDLEIRPFTVSPTRTWRCTEVLFLHLYSGRRRLGDLQHTFESMEWPEGAMITVISVDVAVDALRCDLSRPSIQLRWLQLLEDGEISGLGAGPPCETWSVARFMVVPNCKHPPRPVRFRTQPWGLLDLNGKEAEQVSLGNLLMGFALVASLVHALRGGFLFVEHPADAQLLGFGPPQAPSIWATHLMVQIMATGCFSLLHVSQGYYGAKSAKPTTLLLGGVDSEEAMALEQISRTSALPMTRSVGIVSGEWATSSLKEYPPNFNRFLGKLFGKWFDKQIGLEQRPLAPKHRWVLDLYRDLQDAPTRAGPAPDFYKGPAACN